MRMLKQITEAEAEQRADALVWRRLATDGRYRHAENAEAQAKREDEIAEEVWAYLRRTFEIG